MELQKKLYIIFFTISYLSLLCFPETLDQNVMAQEIYSSEVDSSSNFIDDPSDNKYENKYSSDIKIIKPYNNIYNDVSFAEDFSTDPTESGEEIYKGIKNLKITERTESLILKWDFEGINDTSYIIEWFENDTLIDSADFNGCDQRYEIKNLEACSEYKIIIKSEDSDIEQISVLGKTKFTQPNPPSLRAEPIIYNDLISMNVSWDEPIKGSRCVSHYQVTLDSNIHGVSEPQLVNVSRPKTTWIFMDLYSCAYYFVAIKAIDIENGNGLEATFEPKATNSKISSPPKLMSYSRTETTIKVVWDLQSFKNNCTMKIAHMLCKYSSTAGWGFNTTKESAEDHNNISGRFVQTEVKDLNPYTKYICAGRISNEAGWSNFSTPITATTKDAESSPPANFTIVDKKKFVFQWDKPEYMPGMLQKYLIFFKWKPLSPVPSGCIENRLYVNKNIDITDNNYTWTNWEGYANYSVHMKAQTRKGWSKQSEEITFITKEVRASDNVTNFKFDTKSLPNDTNSLETILSWNLPCSLQGNLTEFDIAVNGFRKFNASTTLYHNFTRTHIINYQFEKNHVFSINLGELKADYTYTYQVRAITISNGTSVKGDVARLKATYPSGIPPEPTREYMKSITLNSDKIVRTSTSFNILLPLFKDDQGPVKYYAIIISRKGYPYKRAHTRFDLSKYDWPNISSWRESMEDDFKLPYQASEPKWSPYPNHILDYGSIRAAKIDIGWDATCKDLMPQTADSRLYCNGPLKPDTWYEVRMRGFTDYGYSDSDPIVVKTSSEVSVVLIISLVIGILFLGILTALLLNKKLRDRKKKKTALEGSRYNKQQYYRNRRATINVHPHFSAQTYPVKSKKLYE